MINWKPVFPSVCMQNADQHGLKNLQVAYWNLGEAQLYEQALQRHEGMLAGGGPFVVRTGQFTGRSPKDKYIVRDETTDSTVQWGSVNQQMTSEQFDGLHQRMMKFWEGQDAFVQDCHAGADAAFRMPIRVITQRAWHSLFARQLFIRPDSGERRCGSRSGIHAVLRARISGRSGQGRHALAKPASRSNFTRRMVLIAGTEYAGEMKKSVFTILNYLLPARGVMPMHCSANIGDDGDVALFFGLSGTGKTTLSADPHRRLIGDDEHGWSDHGVFNFEGGCYAKCIRLSRENEPQIWNAIRFGTVLENVVIDPETRAARFRFGRDHGKHARGISGRFHRQRRDSRTSAGIRRNILFLTADAFGVLPPIRG